MRNWLQSKSFVAVLCVVAGGCVAANFIHLPRRAPLVTNARALSDPQEVTPPPAIVMPPAFRHRESVESWRGLFPLETLHRDPFSPPGIFPSASGVTNSSPNPPSFILQAVSIEGDRSLAVINQTVLAEGESIDGYRIEQILPMQVRLSGALGSVIATLVPTSRDQKDTLGNPPPADHPAVPVNSRPAGKSR